MMYRRNPCARKPRLMRIRAYAMLMRKAYAGGLCWMLMRLLMRQAFVEPYVLTQSASAAKAKSAETLPKENEAKRGTDR